jgi:hypothetical protein
MGSGEAIGARLSRDTREYPKKNKNQAIIQFYSILDEDVSRSRPLLSHDTEDAHELTSDRLFMQSSRWRNDERVKKTCSSVPRRVYVREDAR